MPIYRLDRISHTTVKALDRARTVVAAAVSPLEVHGPHLPIGQDLFEADAFLRMTAEEMQKDYPDWNFLLLPPIPVATDCVPKIGSVSFPARCVRDVAYYALAPFAKEGFARLAYSSFHGGPRHICALEDAADSLTRDFGVPAVSVFSVAINRMITGNPFFDAVKNQKGRKIQEDQIKKDQHAGFVETSLGLHLWPDLVDDGWQSLPESTSDPQDVSGDSHNSLLFGYADQGGIRRKLERASARIQSAVRLIRHFKECTYIGYPAMASAENGKALTRHGIGLSKSILTEFIERGSSMETHSPLWPFRSILMNRPLNYIVDDWLHLLS